MLVDAYNAAITDSKSFESKVKITGKAPVLIIQKIAVPLKYQIL